MYLYLKALHIIFIVTWFAGLFYIVRLFIYNAEANEKTEPEKSILKTQFTIMIKRLWLGITWPSAVITLILGPLLIFINPAILDTWLWIKIGFVIGLYLYHYTLHVLYKQQKNNNFKYSSQQLRIWNEVATVFLISIVMLVVVKQGLSAVWALLGLFLFILVLMSGIKIYKLIRTKRI
jgi:putative membrane protein